MSLTKVRIRRRGAEAQSQGCYDLLLISASLRLCGKIRVLKPIPESPS